MPLNANQHHDTAAILEMTDTSAEKRLLCGNDK